MSDENLSDQRVFDPDLGKERDAFPGEIVAPEEEKTLQRLMREGRNEFQTIFDAVKNTGQLNDDELTAVLKAGEAYGEIKRREYLEAIRTNPANLIANILMGLQPDKDPNLKKTLVDLNGKVAAKVAAIKDDMSASKLKGEELTKTRDSAKKYLRSEADYELSRYLPVPGEGADLKIETILDKLGAFPNDERVPLIRIRSILSGAGNDAKTGISYFSDAPYVEGNSVNNLKATSPLFEGVYVSLRYDRNGNVSNLFIDGDEGFWARVVDTGQFVPYESS